MPQKLMIRSKRIYADTLEHNMVDALNNQIDKFNEAVRYAYNLHFDMFYHGETIAEDSVYLHMQKRYPFFSVYYLNSIVNEGKAKLSSQKELIKLYIEEKEVKIKSVKDKIAKEEKKLKNYESLKLQFIKRSRAIKHGKKPQKFKPYFGSNIYVNKNDENVLLIRRGCGKKAAVEPISYTEAETYNQDRIRSAKSKIGHLNFKLRRLEEKLELLNKQLSGEAAPKRICFGSKAFFKLKDTTEIDLGEWKKEFAYRRNHEMMISGKSEGGFGNLVFKYSADTEELAFFTGNKQQIVFPKVTFPYGGDLLKAELKNKNHGPIAYKLIKHYDKAGKLYFIIQAILTLPEKKTYFIPHDGVMSIDINPDRIDMVELNGYGCMIHREVFKMDLNDKSTNQIANIIDNIVAKIIKYCVKANKPLVMEDLDFEASKNKLMYGNKSHKKMLTQFAYKHITTSFEARAYKDGVYIKKVNPAFTSMLAKTKYMRKMRLPIHTVAAMIIGRRGMGFEENIPAVYTKAIDFSTCKNKFAEYSKLNSKTKKIPINCFYKKIEDFKTFSKENQKTF